ncbi:hypothetical protein GGR51DRAFT_409380 [Nemania sp. FL0031]|nr:hypothetical protein GGR51DRAFT_409380 [Nemania sp. FL0031]
MKMSSTVLLPRNKQFFGLTKQLELLHEYIGQKSENVPKRQTSCMLHGIGGSGKTSLALEYTYRYRSSFKHVFWVSAEHIEKLEDSFSLIATTVLPVSAVRDRKQATLQAKHWLGITDDSWLLVFDNVTNIAVLTTYLPTSANGSILLTTQLSDGGDIATHSIHVQGFTNRDEAVDLFRHYLNKQSSTNHDIEQALEVVGGLPAAITHAAGLINQTDCSMSDFVETVKGRGQRSMYFATEEASQPTTIFHYGRALSLVFSMALDSLDPDVRKLLECLAFLDPNGIPEEVVFPTGCINILGNLGIVEKLSQKEIREQLTSRHLVQIQSIESNDDSLTSPPQYVPTQPTLLVHRSVQQVLLFQLDENQNMLQTRFRQAFQLIRRVVPKQSPYRDPINHLWPTYEKYIGNVRSLYYNFVSSKSSIQPFIELAELFSDVGNYLWEKNISTEFTWAMLETAKKICDEILDPEDSNPVRAGLFAVIASFELNSGPDSRQSCLEHMRRILTLRKLHLTSLSKHNNVAQMVDGLLLGSAYNNLAWTLITMDEFDEAEHLLEKSIEVKHAWATEETAPFPFAEYYKNIAHIRLYQGRTTEAIDLMSKARKMLRDTKGIDAGATMLFSFILGNMHFCAGCILEALEEHKQTLILRETKLGNRDPYTLDSYHAVAVVYHRLGNLNAATSHIENILQYRDSWYPMNVARSLYRMFLIQRDRGRDDAKRYLEEAIQIRDSLAILKSENNNPGIIFDLNTEEGEIACFDYLTPLASGRMFGKMNHGSKGSMSAKK